MSVDPSSEVAERGIPQVGRPRKGNRWFLLAFVALGIVLVMALAARAMLGALASRNHTSHAATLSPTLPDLTRTAFEGPSAPPPPPPSGTSAGTSALAGQTSAPMTPAQKAAADLAERRKRAPLLAIGGASPTSQSAAEQPPTALPGLSSFPIGGNGSRGQRSQPPQSTLSNALGATRTAQVSASLLPDPNMTLTQGMFLDCILQTALSSEVPGMTSCVLARNVYSTNGKVLLLERGSRLVGQYQAAQLRQGQSRIFVLWTRAETPYGVIINLDSPNTDALGRSGLDGAVDNHFWSRFGSALLVSVVDDLASNAVQNGGGSNNNSLTFTNTTNSANDAAAIIVENTVNIPPTLTKAQGAHINIFVARDLYFGNVYGLTAAR